MENSVSLCQLPATLLLSELVLNVITSIKGPGV